MTEPQYRVPDPEWNAWGSADDASPLPGRLRTLLEQALGVPHADTPPVEREGVLVGAAELPAPIHAELARIVGEDGIRTDEQARLWHAGGKSTTDLLRRRAGDAASAPAAVVLPADGEQVAEVLARCAEHRVAVVPFGGGTSVVGGVEPDAGGFDTVVALDLRSLDRLLELDTESGTATLQAGLRGPEVEALLGAQGYTLGHFPQSFEHATIGGYAAARSSGQASAGYGRFDDMVVRLTVATPQGTLHLGRAPASAAGPDLRALFLGSEGTLGVITEVTVRVRRKPAETGYAAWSFPDFAGGAAALRTLAQADALPTVARLSDETETGLNLASAHDVGGQAPEGGCLLVTVAERESRHEQLLHDAGGTQLGPQPAQSWERGRFHAPYLRDALLDVNAIAETLETACVWSQLQATYTAVRDALTATLQAGGTTPLVMCHISHIYPTGASLYFTVVCARGEDPIAQWHEAKRAATDAIAGTGATISHHHGVGLDHRAWMHEEIGELGVAVLRAVKSTLDPNGVLNPGKLIP